ncbi:uncharacterized protein LOC121235362 [Juglans microcarpa x Juglans regia]|uniref:uncharacterized protein LOC121235362 n=1 Tax=Juglans microcarpa x Juglans regia TaxID=2249226 RepID=UPI001B7E726A|nr:uncharacterized protein LOC121235362 [Juglans microcarpa x Juglans regia]
MSLYKSYSYLSLSITTEVRKICRLQPPLRGYLKLNVDEAVFSDMRKTGIGLILRDSYGKMVMTTTISEIEVNEPATIELLAVLRGLQLCIPLGIPKLIIESDYLLMVQELQAAYDTFSANGNLVMEVKSLMNYFQEVSIEHVN